MPQQEILIGDLISRYAAGERNFSEVIIETPFPQTSSWELGHFRGLDLSGIILRNSSIRWIAIYMDGVILRGADLTDVDLGESNFEGADLSNAILRETKYFQSAFNGANLSGADLTGAELVDSGFIGVNLCGANFTNARIDDITFACNNLNKAIFNGARLKNVLFDEAKLVRTDFRGADFGKDKRGASGVRFRDCCFGKTLMPDGSVRGS
ncbi:pentapeptide repeat-containing protein [Tolypothrix bouteillei VB521301]|uniref:Pentapeptide repeat-containing protein n=3 Tax=Nostocales TaxID=1161 RepID=A0A8S9TGH9_9CYAN|nr:pentapeptide repeat-containing protein [Tolypothrix bouteillei VB521301]